MQNQEQVVFKRARTRYDEDFHSGAWKVAFADFMIALMALFLVLWVMQVVDKEDRKAIMAHLHSSSVFDKSYGNPFDSEQSISPIDLAQDSSVPSQHDSNHIVHSYFQGNGEGPEMDALIPGQFDTQEQLAQLAKIVEELVKQSSAEGNVNISVVPQGLRLVLQDDKHNNMFTRGDSTLTPFFEDLLLVFAPVFKRVTNAMIISGHTDSIPFKNNLGKRSNWDLSSARAGVARSTLVTGGMPESRIFQVTGMSSRLPLSPEQPESSENRRIELFILTTPAQEMLEGLFGHNDSELDKAKHNATMNQPVSRQKILAKVTE
ncbi:flagellar motor protein MotB [Vibrio sagamiensis]|uniref:Chemotaxis protein LafU n=1 Tax=Vibrio sagamiensis NBRC 104589 TaxID=1219064 RepID=A0A511QD17_9VIBR|nr:flagellar motor protein MotB [Vibrio sagamiensis]PNQ64889.1 chemotaxis protein [Vibrio agarivorans]GEM75200.1 chemotaxis protein LafU [Vibrio sagamiensis NBRC 104589]